MSSRRRRNRSTENSLLRVAEANAVSKTQNNSDENVTQTSLGGDISNEDVPWTMMVNTPRSIIDANKRNNVFQDSMVDSDADTSKGVLKFPPQTKDVLSKLDESKAEYTLPKRRTLKPIEVNAFDGLLDDNAFDSEIQVIQGEGHAFHSPRHSVLEEQTFHSRSSRRFSVDSGIKLPSINEFYVESNVKLPNINKFNKKQNNANVSRTKSFSDQSLDREFLSESENEKRVKSVKKSKHQKSKSKHPLMVDPTYVPELKITDHNDRKPEISSQKIHRPTANATIVIQGESDDADRISRYAGNNDERNEEMQRRTSSSFYLPIISQSPSILRNNGNHNSVDVKTVTFDEDPMRQRSGSDCSSIRSSGAIKQVPRNGRRKSMASATLQLFVDSHHGAAKLRYIDRLATEMEREEAAKHPHLPEPEVNAFDELQNCRYLRNNTRKGSEDSDNSEAI